jgi:hypothetical protein
VAQRGGGADPPARACRARPGSRGSRAFRDRVARRRAARRPFELLSKPIPLTDCPGVAVVEWRADSHVRWTGPSEPGTKVMSRACALALQRYPEFLTSKHLSFSPAPLHLPISLLPANTWLDGRRPRNLNDGEGRFATVTPRDSAGRRFVIWGVYDLSTASLFVRNDPITKEHRENRFFVKIFLHELAHALNDQWGVQARHFPGDKDRDEQLAEEWTAFAGYRTPDDSSAWDYELKGFL